MRTARLALTLAATLFVAALALAVVRASQPTPAYVRPGSFDEVIQNSSGALFRDGQQIFRAGLKVDVDMVPQPILAGIQAGRVNLNDPANTLALIQAKAVLGVMPASNGRVGFTCALCHSTVDNSFAPGIGSRLDGWPNRDLNVGAIVRWHRT